MLVFIILDAVTVTVGFPFGIPILDSPIEALLVRSELRFRNDLLEVY